MKYIYIYIYCTIIYYLSVYSKTTKERKTDSQLGSFAAAQESIELSNIIDEEFGVFQGEEMPTLLGLAPLDDIKIGLGPPLRCTEDFPRCDATCHGGGHVLVDRPKPTGPLGFAVQSTR